MFWLAQHEIHFYIFFRKQGRILGQDLADLKKEEEKQMQEAHRRTFHPGAVSPLASLNNKWPLKSSKGVCKCKFHNIYSFKFLF